MFHTIATKLPLKLEAPHYPSNYPSQGHGPLKPKLPLLSLLPIITLSFIKNLGKLQKPPFLKKIACGEHL